MWAYPKEKSRHSPQNALHGYGASCIGEQFYDGSRIHQWMYSMINLRSKFTFWVKERFLEDADRRKARRRRMAQCTEWVTPIRSSRHAGRWLGISVDGTVQWHDGTSVPGRGGVRERCTPVDAGRWGQTKRLSGVHGVSRRLHTHISRWQRVAETRVPDGFYPIKWRVWNYFFYPWVYYWAKYYTHRVWRVRVWVFTTHTRLPAGKK